MIKVLGVRDETVLASVKEDGEFYVLSNPIALHFTQDPSTGQPACIQLPFAFGATNVRIKKSNLVFEADPPKEMATGYSAHQAGIAIPQNAGGLILPH